MNRRHLLANMHLERSSASPYPVAPSVSHRCHATCTLLRELAPSSSSPPDEGYAGLHPRPRGMAMSTWRALDPLARCGGSGLTTVRDDAGCCPTVGTCPTLLVRTGGRSRFYAPRAGGLCSSEVRSSGPSRNGASSVCTDGRAFLKWICSRLPPSTVFIGF